MRIAVRTWAKNHNAVSVDYGPLTFSLKIGEKWTRYGGTDDWPEWEVHPTTAWNYGFVLNEGPHALYRAGAGMAVLAELGIVPRGHVPPTPSSAEPMYAA